MNDQDKGPNQGEGDRLSARRYDNHVREFVADGKVEEAAAEAREFVEKQPRKARKAEERAQRGPRMRRFMSLDNLVAKGHTVLDRVQATAERLRARFAKK